MPNPARAWARISERIEINRPETETKIRLSFKSDATDDSGSNSEERKPFHSTESVLKTSSSARIKCAVPREEKKKRREMETCEQWRTGTTIYEKRRCRKS